MHLSNSHESRLSNRRTLAHVAGGPKKDFLLLVSGLCVVRLSWYVLIAGLFVPVNDICKVFSLESSEGRVGARAGTAAHPPSAGTFRCPERSDFWKKQLWRRRKISTSTEILGYLLIGCFTKRTQFSPDFKRTYRIRRKSLRRQAHMRSHKLPLTSPPRKRRLN